MTPRWIWSRRARRRIMGDYVDMTAEVMDWLVGEPDDTSPAARRLEAICVWIVSLAWAFTLGVVAAAIRGWEIWL